MNLQNNKLKAESSHQEQDRKSISAGGFIVLLIALSPLLFYLYKSFPDTPVWETPFFELSTAYGSWFNYAWYLTSKIVPLYLLLIWFFTCKHWWHWILMVPIAMYIFQLWSIFNESQDLDEIELYYLLLLMMIVVPVVYLIRAKLFAKIRGADLKSFEEDLGVKKSVWQQLGDLFR